MTKPRPIPRCSTCFDVCWVCENHPLSPWDATAPRGCTCSAGNAVPGVQPIRCRPPAAPADPVQAGRRQARSAPLSPPRRSTHRSPARILGRVVEGAEAGPFPGFIQPCRPTERKVPQAGEGWLHEIMHDGYRLQAQVREGVPRL